MNIPGPGVICGLSLLLVLALALRVFLRVLRFSSLLKINICKFQFDREFEGHGFISRSLLCATLVKQSQFIYLFRFARIFKNYFIKAIGHFFCVYIASSKQSEDWENSRRLCKPSTTSRVCITVSNSPPPPPPCLDEAM